MVGKFGRPLRRPRSINRRLMPAIVVLVGAGALAAPGVAAAASPNIVVAGDSVLATSLPSFGQATVDVTRPDAVTGQPVVIGTFSGSANPFTPLSVNTTTPTPLASSGDCWQKGALSQALTPDIQAGDTVSVSQVGFFGTGGTSTSVVVQTADEANATLGPIAGCSSIAPWARNAITTAPATIGTGEALTVSGLAQPLATGVSVSASDGSKSSAPVSATPASDGTWAATIPAAQLEKLGDKDLSVTPVVSVPDASTAATAHIAGVGVTVTRAGQGNAGGGGASSSTTEGTSTQTSSGPKSVKATVASVRVVSRVALSSARKHGVAVSFVVPDGVRALQIRLRQNGKVRYTAFASTSRPGTRQTITIPHSLFRRLTPGRYTLYIRAGVSRNALGAAVSHTLRLTAR